MGEWPVHSRNRGRPGATRDHSRPAGALRSRDWSWGGSPRGWVQRPGTPLCPTARCQLPTTGDAVAPGPAREFTAVRPLCLQLLLASCLAVGSKCWPLCHPHWEPVVGVGVQILAPGCSLAPCQPLWASVQLPLSCQGLPPGSRSRPHILSVLLPPLPRARQGHSSHPPSGCRWSLPAG